MHLTKGDLGEIARPAQNRVMPAGGAPNEPGPNPRTELARLYPPLAPALHAWACLRLGTREHTKIAPEDLTQEVWLRSVEVFASWDPTRCSFRAWLFTVGKNVLLELRRRARKSSREEGAHGSSTRLLALDQVPLDITSITRRVAKDEEIQTFVKKLGELDEVDRMTVVHCGLEELSLRDASARLGENYDATAKRWQRLRERIRGWGTPLGLLQEG